MDQITLKSSSDLGKYARKARITANLTQAQVAAFSRVGKRFIYDLENGKATAQVGKTLHVLGALGISIILKPREFGRD